MTRTRITQILALLFSLICMIGAGFLVPMINAQRTELQVETGLNIGEGLPPQIVLATTALGSFRGLFVDILWHRANQLKEDGKFLNQEIDKYANKVLLPEMKKVFPNASIKKDIIGEIIGFDREDKSDACELISSLTGDNSRQVVSFGTEAGLFQEIGISTVVCGPGSIDQAHKIDEFILLDELKKCLNLLDGIKQNSINN